MLSETMTKELKRTMVLRTSKMTLASLRDLRDEVELSLKKLESLCKMMKRIPLQKRKRRVDQKSKWEDSVRNLRKVPSHLLQEQRKMFQVFKMKPLGNLSAKRPKPAVLSPNKTLNS